MIQTRILTSSDKDAVTELFVNCFINNDYYIKQFGEDTEEQLRKIAKLTLNYLIEEQGSYVVSVDNKIIATLWATNYTKLKQDPQMLTLMFSSTNNLADNPYYKYIDLHMDTKTDSYFILTCAVAEEYRNQGIAKSLITRYFETHRANQVASDVTSKYMLYIFNELNFDLIELDSNYWFCTHTEIQ